MDSPADFGLCQPSVNVSPEKDKQNQSKSCNSIPYRSLISILHIICDWQDSVGCINFIIFRPMLPTICLRKKRSSFPSLLHGRRHEVGSLRAELFLAMRINAVAQKHAWCAQRLHSGLVACRRRFLTLDGSDLHAKLYVVSENLETSCSFQSSRTYKSWSSHDRTPRARQCPTLSHHVHMDRRGPAHSLDRFSICCTTPERC